MRHLPGPFTGGAGPLSIKPIPLPVALTPPFLPKIRLARFRMQTFYDIFETTAYLSAAGLVALMLIAVPAPPTRSRLLSFVAPLIWIFLAAATVFSTAYLWELIDVSTSGHPFERIAFWTAHAELSSGWTYWLNIALELSAQLLWFSRFRSQPHAILLIACAFLMSPGSERLIYVIH